MPSTTLNYERLLRNIRLGRASGINGMDYGGRTVATHLTTKTMEPYELVALLEHS
jgi:hypothetical protein